MPRTDEKNLVQSQYQFGTKETKKPITNDKHEGIVMKNKFQFGNNLTVW